MPGRPILFVCMRPEHHRRRSPSPEVCDHLGCAAYCPAPAARDHEWVPLLTDMASLRCLGYRPAGPEDGATTTAGEEDLVLIRR